jgi:hypothetical protein
MPQAGRVKLNIRVRSESNKPWHRVPYNTDDGLSAPLSITKFQQSATLSR